MGPERKKMPHGNYQPEAFEIINKKYLSSYFFPAAAARPCVFFTTGVLIICFMRIMHRLPFFRKINVLK